MPVPVWQFAEFEFHQLRHELRRSGKVVPVESKPKEVLLYLLRHAGRIVSPDEIKGAVWQAKNLSELSVAVAVGKLRDAFGDTDRQRVLRTVKGGGYTMAVSVVLAYLAEESARPEDLLAGQEVPGRPGWLLKKHLEQEGGYACWLSCQADEESRRVVHLAWDERARVQLQSRVEALECLNKFTDEPMRFPRLLTVQWESEPALIETDWLGPTLPQWAAEQGGLRAMSETVRVALGAELATAIEAAHGLGLIHGSLCLSDVHIVKSGAGWSVRLDGFGRQTRVSRAGDSIEGSHAAQPGSIYQAPELNGGERPTIAGDIYAFGVILYQMVAADLTAGPLPGWEQRIEDPLLRQDIADAAALDPGRRHATPGLYTGRLRELAERRRANDLLEESRRRAELAERLLAAEQAKRPLWRALAMSAMLLVLVASFAALRYMSDLRRGQRAALAQARHARALQTFLEGLFWDGDVAARGPMTAEGLADRGLEKSHLLVGEPEEHAELLTTLGASYDALGNYAKAEHLLAQALEERRRTDGPESPEFAATLTKEAALKSDEHQPRVALPLAEQALSIERRTLPATDLALSRAEALLGEIWTELGEDQKAVPLLEGAVRRESGQPELLDDLSGALNDLSITESNLGHLERSLDLQEQSMSIDRALLGNRHPDIAEHLLTIDNAHVLLGQYDQAAAEASEALSIFRESLPAGHHEIAAAQAHLGTALAHVPSRVTEARASLEEALHTLEREPQHSATEAYALLAIGSVAFQQGHDAEALARYRESLKIYQQLYTRPHFSWSIPLTGTAEVLCAEHKWQDAQRYAEEAYRVSSATLHVDDPRRIKTSVVYARSLVEVHQTAQAAMIFREILADAPPGNSQVERSRKEAKDQLAQIAATRQ